MLFLFLLLFVVAFIVFVVKNRYEWYLDGEVYHQSLLLLVLVGVIKFVDDF